MGRSSSRGSVGPNSRRSVDPNPNTCVSVDPNIRGSTVTLADGLILTLAGLHLNTRDLTLATMSTLIVEDRNRFWTANTDKYTDPNNRQLMRPVARVNTRGSCQHWFDLIVL